MKEEEIDLCLKKEDGMAYRILILKLTRKQTSLYVELITGQNNLNYVQSKIKEISPECRFCEEEDETFPHILNECPVFRQRR